MCQRHLANLGTGSISWCILRLEHGCDMIVWAVLSYLVNPEVVIKLGLGWGLVGIWPGSGQFPRTWCTYPKIWTELGLGWNLVGIWFVWLGSGRGQAVLPYLMFPQIGTRLGFGWDPVEVWAALSYLVYPQVGVRLGFGWDLVGIWWGSGQFLRTWCILRLGSGEMTVRLLKSTRLPLRFPRNRPCFPFRRCTRPRVGFFGWKPEAACHKYRHAELETGGISGNILVKTSRKCDSAL